MKTAATFTFACIIFALAVSAACGVLAGLCITPVIFTSATGWTLTALKIGVGLAAYLLVKKVMNSILLALLKTAAATALKED